MGDPTYTILIRVPTLRGDFVDPPPVHWEPSNDDALWKMLSSAAQADIDWPKVADQFQVPVEFLLQHVAYMADRHASQVRAQVIKATAAARSSAAPSPIPATENARAPSALSIRRDRESPLPSATGNTTPIAVSGRPMTMRNTSTNANSSRDQAGRQRLSSLPISSPTRGRQSQKREPSPAKSDSTTSTASSDQEESSPAQSRIIRRPPRFQQQDVSLDGQGDNCYGDDDDADPAFQLVPANVNQDLTSTLRGDGWDADKHGTKQPAKGHPAHKLQSSESSVSSGPGAQGSGKAREPKTPGPGPLSPRRTAELSGRSPGHKGKAASSRDGSDGAPSMSSSFSDLDDASVTQSALEEALASHMKSGGISSRFSITQAFRSRYSPGSNQQ
ncbi:hypothetical protein CDD81_3673 [Ophiocordyceps australis]|uniref:Autophagy-related protein 29 n=1 Tax=Ophiocordyceps australis TaxID=1399860 RepID=A0A2C5XX29_9HYPO|nr:hypothetical protein CDD81_3673 [Ophiocordyceps australis]